MNSHIQPAIHKTHIISTPCMCERRVDTHYSAAYSSRTCRTAHSTSHRTYGARLKVNSTQELAQDKNPQQQAATIRIEGEVLVSRIQRTTCAQVRREPWKLVADGYAETTMLLFEQFANEAIAASELKPKFTAHSNRAAASPSPVGRP